MSFPPQNKHLVTAVILAVTMLTPSSRVLGAATAAPPPSPQQLPTLEKTALPRLPAPPMAANASVLRSVALIRPKTELWSERIEVSGNVMPWQESQISTEIGGLRLANILVNEGDTVKKGQILARLNAASVETDLDVANAQQAEAEAMLAQAAATLERGNRLAPSGGVSRQELTLYETQKHTAEARLNAARAQVRRQQQKLEQATLSAPDDGIISASLATEGSIVQAGSELFRLIRQGRLEWRAEVRGELLMKLAVGQEVMIKSPLGNDIKAHVRRISPTIDLGTRHGLVYVDVPQNSDFKAGLKVAGSINLGKRKALVIPLSALLDPEGTPRVFKLDTDSKLEAIAVKTGRIKDRQVEILSGLDEQTQVVARDLQLLREGEPVKIITTSTEALQP